MRLEVTQWIRHPIYHLSVFSVKLVLAIYLGEHGCPPSLYMAISHVIHNNVLYPLHFSHRQYNRSQILKEAFEDNIETTDKKKKSQRKGREQ